MLEVVVGKGSGVVVVGLGVVTSSVDTCGSCRGLDTLTRLLLDDKPPAARCGALVTGKLGNSDSMESVGRRVRLVVW